MKLDHTASDFTPEALLELSRVFFHEAESVPVRDERDLDECDRLLMIAGEIRARAVRADRA